MASRTTPPPNSSTGSGSQSQSQQQQQLARERGSDYVYFERTAAGMSDDAVPKAKTAQMKLEHFYQVAVQAAVDRNQRRVELERKLAADTMLTDERKQRQIAQLGRRESTFLRLRRTKLGLDDFRTVKVIGKGAFGEVRPAAESRVLHAPICSHALQRRFGLCRRSTPARSML